MIGRQLAVSMPVGVSPARSIKAVIKSASLTMTQLHDRWFRIIGVPLIALIALVIYHEGNIRHGVSVPTELIHSMVAIVLIWEVNRQIIIRSRITYPGLKNTRPRIIFLLLWALLITTLIRLSISFFYSYTQFWGYTFSPLKYVYNVLFGLLITVPILAIYEGVYLYKEWYKTYYEAERLKKENLQTQLDTLKSQIQPHFLFNSLSTLSALVQEDPKQAERFIEELSSVYRYLLQTNEQSITTLESELAFIEAYFHLLKTRFGQGITLTIDVDEACLPMLIPPLTLQLLVENAVKHNVANARRPLHIRLYSDPAGHLCVVNNYQPKPVGTVTPGGTGLKNISTKYRLLRQSAVVVQQTDVHFFVMIPLIKSQTVLW